MELKKRWSERMASLIKVSGEHNGRLAALQETVDNQLVAKTYEQTIEVPGMGNPYHGPSVVDLMLERKHT